MDSYCTYVAAHWSIKSSSVAYSATAGVFAAVMLPFIGVILSGNTQALESDTRAHMASIRMPILVLGAFLFCLTAAFFYGDISGDSSCIRANLVDGPASFLFGQGAAMSIVGLVWFVELRHAHKDTRQAFQSAAILGLIFIAIEVLLTILQMLLSTRGSKSMWPRIPDILIILLPPALAILSTGSLYQMGVNLQRVSSHLRYVFPFAYLTSVALGIVFVNGQFSRPSGSSFWLLAIAAYAWVFGITLAVLIASMPRRSNSSEG